MSSGEVMANNGQNLAQDTCHSVIPSRTFRLYAYSRHLSPCHGLELEALEKPVDTCNNSPAIGYIIGRRTMQDVIRSLSV